METVIVFLVVFIPVVWGIWRMLLFTRDTIGRNSPLKTFRTYKTTPWSFFVRMDPLAGLGAFLFSGYLFNVALFGYIPPEEHEVLSRIFLFVLAFLMITIGIFVFALYSNHWRYAKGIIINTFPDTHELEIAFPDVRFRLNSNNIERVREYNNDNVKLPLICTEYFLTNGDHFIISAKANGAWVIQEYFKSAAVEVINQKTSFI